jgi:DNA replication protein DnaC
MNEQTLERMRQLKLYGMHRAFETMLETRQHQTLNAGDLINSLLQSEWEERHNKRMDRLLKSARFRYQASVEEISFPEGRNLDKALFLQLADCSYIDRRENILITGPTGVGKSFLASALGHQACNQGYRVVYFNTQKLFAKLKLSRAEGTYIREVSRVEKADLLLLDDFGLQPLDSTKRMELLEIIEDRHGKKSSLICSQLPVKQWYEIIDDSTIADAILDRLIHTAHRLELKGESWRKKNAL